MEIIKEKGYYYINHSFRKKGKVVNRKKYLGKDIPENIKEMKEIFLRDCLKEELFLKLEKIKKNFNKEKKRLPESIRTKDLERFSIELTYNTNAIEGSTISLEETEELLERDIAPRKPIKDIKETLNHANLFKNMVQNKERLSEKIILRWHKEIFGETKKDIGGRYREYRIRVGSYIAPDWQEVKGLMEDFFRWYNKNNKIMHPIELAARAHYKFEKIHPFGDGNGRIGRLMISYILNISGFPQIIIEYKRRNYYYKALEKDENKFLSYFLRRYIRYNKDFLS